MAINPAIAMSFQAPKFEDPMNRLVQMEQMKAYQQNALAKQMEMESAKEAMAQQKGLRNYLSGLSPNEMPSLGEMAQYGDKGLSMFNALSEAQEKQREAAANIYKEVYLPMLSSAKTAKDVYNWRQAVKSDPRVAPVVTKEADYGLPKTDEEVPAYLEQHFVPYSERYKQAAMDKRAQAKIDAEANQPQRPFQIGPNLVSPTGEVIYQGTEEGPSDWQKVTDEKGQVLFYSPSTNQVRTSPGVELDKGVTPTAAQQEKQQAKEAALSGISDILNRASKAFDVLEKENAIVDPSKSVGENIAASVVSSPIGRQVGQVVGSKAQQARNELSRLGPLFVTQLKNATGLSASQLNSNVELQLFLKTIEGDDLVTARKQIELLKNMFAKGQAPKNLKEVTQKFNKMNREAGIKDDAEPSDAGPPPGVDAEDWQFMTPEQKALFQTEE